MITLWTGRSEASRRLRSNVQVEEEYDYSNIWGEEYYDESGEVEERVLPYQERINWAKYGRETEERNETELDILEEIPDNIYCDLVTTLTEKCLQTSLLEIWRYEEQTVRSTTSQEVVTAVNSLVRSPWYGYTTDYTRLLGGLERDERGEVMTAQTALMVWTLSVPEDVELDRSQGGGLELEPADKTTIHWEQQFIEIALNASDDKLKFVPNAVKSFSDVRNVIQRHFTEF